MKDTMKKVAIALLAAVAASIGTALGELARDEIKKRLDPPAPQRSRRKKARR